MCLLHECHASSWAWFMSQKGYLIDWPRQSPGSSIKISPQNTSVLLKGACITMLFPTEEYSKPYRFSHLNLCSMLGLQTKPSQLVDYGHHLPTYCTLHNRYCSYHDDIRHPPSYCTRYLCISHYSTYGILLSAKQWSSVVAETRKSKGKKCCGWNLEREVFFVNHWAHECCYILYLVIKFCLEIQEKVVSSYLSWVKKLIERLKT